MRLQKQEKRKKKKYFWGIENLSCNCISESNSSTNSLHDYCETLFPLVSFLNTFSALICMVIVHYIFSYCWEKTAVEYYWGPVIFDWVLLTDSVSKKKKKLGTSKLSRFKLSRFIQLLPVLILLSSCRCQLKITEKPLSSIFFAYECNIKRNSLSLSLYTQFFPWTDHKHLCSNANISTILVWMKQLNTLQPGDSFTEEIVYC